MSNERDPNEADKPGRPGPREILFLAIPFSVVVLIVLWQMRVFS